MTIFMFANNVSTTLAGGISSSSTSLTLSSSADLPTSIPSGQALVITLNDIATRQNFEIIYATSISGATLSGLLRGQEGTAALSWTTGDLAYSPPTAGQMANFMQNPQAIGRLLSIQTFLVNGTYNPSSSLVTRVVAKLKGGGAGSAGSVATGANQVSAGGPGGEGAYCETLITSGFSGQTVTVGAGGLAGTSGGNGGNGGASTFMGATAGGGFGGGASAASNLSAVAGASGIATASGGNILNDNGGGGDLSYSFAQGSGGLGISGMGGGGTQPAAMGQRYGSGGGGTTNGFNSAAIPGYAGKQGYVEIWEYA